MGDGKGGKVERITLRKGRGRSEGDIEWKEREIRGGYRVEGEGDQRGI